MTDTDTAADTTTETVIVTAPSPSPAAESAPAQTPAPASNVEVAATPTLAPAPTSAAGPAAAPASGNRKRGRGRGADQTAPAQGARATAAPVLERLFQLYPRMFGARFLPLKLGVFHDLMARHGEEFKRDDLKAALGQHARSTRYLEAVAAGNKRHDLAGEPVEDLAPEHVHHAILEVFRRRQARAADKDLRPEFVGRIAAAIEAAGLSREDYVLAVRATDDAGLALIDEAVAILGERQARREALRRAFEASGQDVEAFAAMYGMNPREVRRTLGA